MSQLVMAIVGPEEVLMESHIPFLTSFKRGKVRDVYEIGENLLIVATDRISAYDVVMKSGIPGKGIYLTKQSSFWFRFLEKKGYPTHFISDDLTEIIDITGEDRLEDLWWLEGRCMLCKKAEAIPVEAIARFKVFGSAVSALRENKWIWDPVETVGEPVAGAVIKDGPVFTPTEKSETDEKITFERMVEIIGDEELAHEIKEITIEIFNLCNEHACNFGFEIADGKVEYGMIDGELALIDETFTSDSARFIPDRSKDVFRKYLKDNGLEKKSIVVPVDLSLEISKRYKDQCETLGVL